MHVTSFAHDLHLRVAQLTGNRAIELFLGALTRLTEQHTRSIEDDLDVSFEDVRSQVVMAHSGIVDAIVAGNRELARRRMQRHLEAMRLMIQ
jgi:DNA-binding FadR family transcriptional regulator